MSELIFETEKFFPACHANCMLPLDDGRILVAYFAGAHEKADDVGIWLSEYDGAAWKAPKLLAKLENVPHWNPVLFAVKDGIRIVFKVGSEIRDWRSFTMLSRDGGRTWSQPHGYAANPAGGPVRSKPIRLSNGALLAPNSDEGEHWRPRVDISRDEGETFNRLAQIPINLEQPQAENYMWGRGAIQPTLWESVSGHVHALLRTSAGRIFRADSEDYGQSWCEAYPTALLNNNSGIDAVKADDGRLFLALNPVGGDFGPRTPICIYMSDDNGQNFKPFATLDDAKIDEHTGKAAEFSYPSLYIKGDKLLATYTFNRRSIAFVQLALQ